MLLHDVILLLGSNIDKEHNIPAAVNLLRELSTVTGVAAVYESAPVGREDVPVFFNTAVRITTPLQPPAIKRNIIDVVERRLKRRRTEDKNAPRTIDVDIVLYDDDVLDYTADDGRQRHVPDPDLLRFSHVAVPVAELVPQRRHPETGQHLSDLAADLLRESTRGGQAPLWPRHDISLS